MCAPRNVTSKEVLEGHNLRHFCGTLKTCAQSDADIVRAQLVIESGANDEGRVARQIQPDNRIKRAHRRSRNADDRNDRRP